jgi:hypothetical protein
MGRPVCAAGFEKTTGLPSIPKDRKSVTYLWAYEQQEGGYMVGSPGITQRTAYQHNSENVLDYLNRVYPILDSEQAKRGIRVVLWEGGTARKDPALKLAFDKRREELQKGVARRMGAVRIVITEGEMSRRVTERLEAAIFKQLQANPGCLLGTGRVTMAGRRADEAPITVESNADELFCNLPGKLEI